MKDSIFGATYMKYSTLSRSCTLLPIYDNLQITAKKKKKKIIHSPLKNNKSPLKLGSKFQSFFFFLPLKQLVPLKIFPIRNKPSLNKVQLKNQGIWKVQEHTPSSSNRSLCTVRKCWGCLVSGIRKLCTTEGAQVCQQGHLTALSLSAFSDSLVWQVRHSPTAWCSAASIANESAYNQAYILPGNQSQQTGN